MVRWVSVACILIMAWFTIRKERKWSMVGDSTEKNNSLDQALRQAQLEQLQLENEKLKRDLARPEKANPWYSRLIQLIPLITTFLAIASFLWGVVQYNDQQSHNRAAQKLQAQQEYMKPWLESQRVIYLQALSAAAVIANTNDPDKEKLAREEFWQLYHGKMILVETKDIANKNGVTSLMIDFGICLNNPNSCGKSAMNTKLHDLGTAMATSMATTARMTYEEFAANQFQYTSGP
jgi:hypothetical protein